MVTDYRGYHSRMPRSPNRSRPDVQLEKDGQFGKTRVNYCTEMYKTATRELQHGGVHWRGESRQGNEALT
jgi:hypothetical protein